jgi:hypothetical protein
MGGMGGMAGIDPMMMMAAGMMPGMMAAPYGMQGE